MRAHRSPSVMRMVHRRLNPSRCCKANRAIEVAQKPLKRFPSVQRVKRFVSSSEHRYGFVSSSELTVEDERRRRLPMSAQGWHNLGSQSARHWNAKSFANWRIILVNAFSVEITSDWLLK